MTRTMRYEALILILGIIAIVGYGLFEARRLIGGPIITIDSPIDGSATSSSALLSRVRA
jgi:hypothetical protein